MSVAFPILTTGLSSQRLVTFGLGGLADYTAAPDGRTFVTRKQVTFVATETPMSYRPHKTAKQPDELFYLNVDFSALVRSGDSIATIAVTVQDNAGEDATSTILVTGTEGESADVVSFQVQGGAGADAPYKIEVQITTGLGDIFECDVYLFITDDDA